MHLRYMYSLYGKAQYVATYSLHGRAQYVTYSLYGGCNVQVM